MKSYGSILLLLCAIIAGCSEDNPTEPLDKVPGTLSAINFPSADGASWEYKLAGGEHSYTAHVSGTRNIGGDAVRILENDSEEPMDYIGASYGLPVRKSLFTKDINSYKEHAFELWLFYAEDTYFQRNLPKRVLWSFPLYKGKEWIVSKQYVQPEFIFTRKVVSVDNKLTVPAGSFDNVFYAEEYISISGENGRDIIRDIIGKYWLASDVGVIKYEYVDPVTGDPVAYELSRFNLK